MIELSVADAVERAATLATGGRTMLGLVGCPGSGKSTLSAAITARVASSVVVPMDGFHMLNDDLVRLGRRDRKGAPDTFDVDGYVRLLERVRRQDATHVVTAPRYDRAPNRRARAAVAKAPSSSGFKVSAFMPSVEASTASKSSSTRNAPSITSP